MANDYVALANVTLGTAASSVTFSSISADYRDLVVVLVASGSTTLQARVRLNSDTGPNYNYIQLSGNGSSASGGNAIAQTSGFLSVVAQATTTARLQIVANIMDYATTDKHTTIISRADQAANGSEAFVNRWANTAAVTSVQVLTSTGNWAIGTTVALYGVAA